MAKKQITLSELNEKLVDISIPESELAKYFVADPARSGLFDPALALNPETVELPTDAAEARARSESAMNFANGLARLRRKGIFNRMMADGYKGPVIVSEGDSWFQYPILLKDTIDHLVDRGFAIRSLGAAGDTLENMIREHEYIEVLQDTEASVFLLSAGGNDALGGGNLKAHLRDYDPALSAAGHLLPSFDTLLDDALAMYERVLREVVNKTGAVTLCHGYDYVIPNSGKWLGKPMEARGIQDKDLQRALTHEMIDRFNTRQKALIDTFGGRVIHVDARSAVGDTLNTWHDELHPKDPGYGRVADRFEAAIKAATHPRSATRGKAAKSKAKPAPARTGMSLHIGLNHISADHYGDDAPLSGCHYDAKDMHQIATDKGFDKPELMLDEQATREAVIGYIQKAAKKLKAGDMFLLTYAGHGSQIPDFNRDERDGSDETLCLYNGMLIDDELFELWSHFAEGVRVVMISDSCHSGTVLRSARRNTGDADGYTGVKTRLLPRNIAERAFRNNRAEYERIGRNVLVADEDVLLKPLDMVVRCSVVLLAGCQDNQESQDGMSNGRFTQELLYVWEQGQFTGSWDEMMSRIVPNMPPNQTPRMMLVGTSPQILAAQPAFAI